VTPLAVPAAYDRGVYGGITGNLMGTSAIPEFCHAGLMPPSGHFFITVNF
jgi:hypothetical protein